MRRVGLIVPSSNIVVEDTVRRLAGTMSPSVAIHVARFSVVSVNFGDDSLGQFENDAIDVAIDQLREAGVDRIVFAGTAGAWLGIERETAWRDRAQARCGMEVTSTTLLAIEAMREIAPSRPALVTPFTTGIHNRIADTFRAEGVPIGGGYCFNLEESREMADIEPPVIASYIGECIGDGADAVLCYCTNFRGLEAAASVDFHGKPAALLDSVGLTLQAIGAFGTE